MSPAAVMLAFGLAAVGQAGLVFWAFGRPAGPLRRQAVEGGFTLLAAVMGRFQAAACALAALGLLALVGAAATWR